MADERVLSALDEVSWCAERARGVRAVTEALMEGASTTDDALPILHDAAFDAERRLARARSLLEEALAEERRDCARLP